MMASLGRSVVVCLLLIAFAATKGACVAQQSTVSSAPVFVIGNVEKQRSLVYREGLTLKQAIAMAGGVYKSSDLVRIRVFRKSSDSSQNRIVLKLNAVLNDLNDDCVLQPWDSIEISDPKGNFLSPFTTPIWDTPPVPRKTLDC